MQHGFQQTAALCAEEKLEVLGARPAEETEFSVAGTMLLLGPGQGFWSHVTAAPEFSDGRIDALDRWSMRVIGGLAKQLGGTALFPFGQTPPLPFMTWALDSGSFWQSPVGLLVHHRQGLWASIRGALVVPQPLEHGPSPANPCLSCTDQPCRTACPVGALTDAGYDLTACHSYLDTEPGAQCMNNGCQVRAACPVSRRFGRTAEQSAYHMKAFHP